jgi:hypothetical protein
VTTEQMIVERYGVTLNTDQLAELLHMGKKSVTNSISADRFPITTFKAGKYRLAHASDVASYLDNQRAAS